MGNARAAIDRASVTTTLYENPELAAMAAICEILRDLSDDERLRVMRWAFGRFSDEFKRPLPDSPIAMPEPAPLTIAASDLPARPAATTAAALDFEQQISELNDLFPSRIAPQRRAGPGDPGKVLEFV